MGEKEWNEYDIFIWVISIFIWEKLNLYDIFIKMNGTNMTSFQEI
jgi:hypothetical protein